MLTTAGWLLAMFFNDSILVVTMILILISFGATMQFAVGPTILAGAVPPDLQAALMGSTGYTETECGWVEFHGTHKGQVHPLGPTTGPVEITYAGPAPAT